ncbi:MAG TPA: Sua5/YciO/YrdC/YwlC family protein, partial [Woeseiaceae bacterium]
MTISNSVNKAARIIREGGVIAYPTEGVFGFGCLPDSWDAVKRILDIKQRDADAGLVLIAANLEQLDGWAELPAGCTAADLYSSLQRPVTWVVPADPAVPAWIRGKHDSIAVR